MRALTKPESYFPTAHNQRKSIYAMRFMDETEDMLRNLGGLSSSLD